MIGQILAEKFAQEPVKSIAFFKTKERQKALIEIESYALEHMALVSHYLKIQNNPYLRKAFMLKIKQMAEMLEFMYINAAGIKDDPKRINETFRFKKEVEVSTRYWNMLKDEDPKAPLEAIPPKPSIPPTTSQKFYKEVKDFFWDEPLTKFRKAKYGDSVAIRQLFTFLNAFRLFAARVRNFLLAVLKNPGLLQGEFLTMFLPIAGIVCFMPRLFINFWFIFDHIRHYSTDPNAKPEYQLDRSTRFWIHWPRKQQQIWNDLKWWIGNLLIWLFFGSSAYLLAHTLLPVAIAITLYLYLWDIFNTGLTAATTLWRGNALKHFFKPQPEMQATLKDCLHYENEKAFYQVKVAVIAAIAATVFLALPIFIQAMPALIALAAPALLIACSLINPKLGLLMGAVALSCFALPVLLPMMPTLVSIWAAGLLIAVSVLGRVDKYMVPRPQHLVARLTEAENSGKLFKFFKSDSPPVTPRRRGSTLYSPMPDNPPEESKLICAY